MIRLIHKPLFFVEINIFNSIRTYDGLLVPFSVANGTRASRGAFLRLEKACVYYAGLNAHVYVRIIRGYVGISWR